jgi:uncharacterized protein with HEPN domain
MRAALTDIQALTANGKRAFQTDRIAQQAVAYNLAVLGEAARALSPELHERPPEVPWRDVIDQRNVVVHEYHRLDLDADATGVPTDRARMGPSRRRSSPHTCA